MAELKIDTVETDDGTVVVSVNQVWFPGIYADSATAERAARDFTNAEIMVIEYIWVMHGDERPVTMADLDQLRKELDG